MSRKSTGSISTSEARRIELSFLLKEGYIEYEYTKSKKLHWTSNNQPSGDIHLQCKYTEQDKWIRLIYTINKVNYDYKVYLEEVESNLGKGKVLYFVCPESGKRCRILYLAYSSPIFKSRDAYKNRIYYETQQCTKTDYWNIRYFQLNSMIDKLWDGQRTSTYKGSITKRIKRIERLTNQKRLCNKNRWSEPGMKKSLIKALRAVDNSNNR